MKYLQMKNVYTHDNNNTCNVIVITLGTLSGFFGFKWLFPTLQHILSPSAFACLGTRIGSCAAEAETVLNVTQRDKAHSSLTLRLTNTSKCT